MKIDNLESLKNKKQNRLIKISVIAVFLVIVLIIGFIFKDYSFVSKQNNAVISSQSVVKKPEVGFIDDQKEITELSKVNIPQLELFIKSEDFQKIKKKRYEAQKIGILFSEEQDEVRGYLKVNGSNPIEISTRLKGDWCDHLNDMKQWSLRIKVQNDESVMGMRRFSIQPNESRGGHKEALLLSYLRKEGILAPRYLYANIFINNKPIGVMAVEEFFSKELVESQGRPDSVFIGFDEEYYWRQRHINRQLHYGQLLRQTKDESKTHMSELKELPFRVFQENEVWKDPVLSLYYKEAIGLLRGYREGKISSENVFDMDLIAKWLAILHTWDNRHGLFYNNIRFYYNPITRLFEPVAFDNWGGSNIFFPEFCLPVSSEVFRKKYIEYLGVIKKEIDSGEFFKYLSKLEKPIVSVLQIQDKSIEPVDKESFITTINQLTSSKSIFTLFKKGQYREENKHSCFLDSKQYVVDPILDAFLIVYCVKDKAGNYLEFQNITDHEVFIDEIFYTSSTIRNKFNLIVKNSINIPPGKDLIPPYVTLEHRIRIPVKLFPESSKESYHVIATYDKNNVKKDIVAHKIFPAFDKAKYKPMEMVEFFERFPFVKAKLIENNSKIAFIIPKGIWNIKENMLVPLDTPLYIEPGATLLFDKNVRLVLHSQLRAKGTKKEPIRFSSKKHNNIFFNFIDPNKWGGLVVLNASEKSVLENVMIEDIGSIKDDDWGLNGAITFYESDVSINSSLFSNNQTEDLLNIVRSKFIIANSQLKKTPSDAFDSDYANGKIINTVFSDIGADAIDISGSNVEAENVSINNAYDKALSIGEKSEFKGNKITIKNAGVAIASKDDSIANIENSCISDIKETVYMAYIKKNEYGKAKLIALNNKLNGFKHLAQALKPSIIEIDGIKQPYINFNVQTMYETGRMKKESKNKLSFKKKKVEPIPDLNNNNQFNYYNFDLSAVKNVGAKWNDDNNVIFQEEGVSIILNSIHFDKFFEITLDFNNNFLLNFYLKDKMVGQKLVIIKNNIPIDGLTLYNVQVPKEVLNTGYDKINVYNIKGDKNYSLGHLLFDKQSLGHYKNPLTKQISIYNLKNIKEKGTPWDHKDNILFDKNGLLINLNKIYHNKMMDVSLSHSNHYQVLYCLNDIVMDQKTIIGQRLKKDELNFYKEATPAEAVSGGYNKIFIYPIDSRNNEKNSIGHLIINDFDSDDQEFNLKGLDKRYESKSALKDYGIKEESLEKTGNSLKWDNSKVLNFDREGYKFKLKDSKNYNTINLTVDKDNSYQILFFKNNKLIDDLIFINTDKKSDELITYSQSIKEKTIASGYDEIIIYCFSVNYIQAKLSTLTLTNKSKEADNE